MATASHNATQTSATSQHGDSSAPRQSSRRYDDITISGSGLTIVGDLYGSGLPVPPSPRPEQFTKFGMCLGAAPQIDAAHFVGRANEIEELRRILEPGKRHVKQQRVILGGMGGIGKTQLAIAFAERHQESYDAIFWLNVTSQLTLHLGLRLILGKIVTASELEQFSDEQVLTRLREWFSTPQNTRWLLIFDNYDEPEQFDIGVYFPYTACGSIIITTRLPDYVHVSSHRMRIQPLGDVQESLEILHKRSQRPDTKTDPGARRLAQRLAGLPLALATAGAYLSKSASISFQQYLDIYEQRWDVNPRRTLQLQEYQDRTLYTTWDMSYNRLEKQDADSASMLQLLAYFDNQDIRYSLLRAGIAADSPAWLQNSLSSPIDFENTMMILVEYGFVDVQTTRQSYSMHSCVHDWTLANLNQSLNKQFYWHVVDCIVSSLSQHKHDQWSHLACSSLVPHATRLSHPRFAEDWFLDDIEPYRLTSVTRVARFLREQMQLTSAEKLHLRVLAGCERILGPEHVMTMHTFTHLGILYSRQGKLDEAEHMYLRALSGYEKALGSGDHSVFKTLSNLGHIYESQGKLEEAEEAYLRALIGKEAVCGPDHISTLNTVHNLGNLYAEQGKLDKAEQMYLRALVGTERELGLHHSATLETVSSLGMLYEDQGKLDKAKEMFERTLEARMQTLGPDHVLTLDSLHCVAYLYANQNESWRAEPIYQQVLAGYEAALGEDHTSTLRVVHNYAVLCERQGRQEESRRMCQRALEGYRKRLGLEHPLTQGMADYLGRLCHQQD